VGFEFARIFVLGPNHEDGLNHDADETLTRAKARIILARTAELQTFRALRGFRSPFVMLGWLDCDCWVVERLISGRESIFYTVPLSSKTVAFCNYYLKRFFTQYFLYLI